MSEFKRQIATLSYKLGIKELSGMPIIPEDRYDITPTPKLGESMTEYTRNPVVVRITPKDEKLFKGYFEVRVTLNFAHFQNGVLYIYCMNIDNGVHRNYTAMEMMHLFNIEYLGKLIDVKRNNIWVSEC